MKQVIITNSMSLINPSEEFKAKAYIYEEDPVYYYAHIYSIIDGSRELLHENIKFLKNTQQNLPYPHLVKDYMNHFKIVYYIQSGYKQVQKDKGKEHILKMEFVGTQESKALGVSGISKILPNKTNILGDKNG